MNSDLSPALRAISRALGVAALAWAAIGAPTSAQSPAAVPTGLRVTLLGTAGGPPPHPDRAQPASLLQVGGKSYLIDAGEGVARQSLRAGVPSSRLHRVFVTHLHWDHTLGLGYLMATGWMMNRTAPLTLVGPPGLAEYVRREGAALGVGEDIFRPQMPSRPPLASLYPVREVDVVKPTEVYRDEAVRVTAALTSHFDTVHGPTHAYGADKGYAYRFDTAQGSVTFTGDTGPSAAVTELARGSDVLVSEICDVESIGQALVTAQGGSNAGLEAMMAHMRQEHLSPEAVGKLAVDAGVKKVVLTHFVIGRGANVDALVARVKKVFSGEVVAGRDLETFDVARR